MPITGSYTTVTPTAKVTSKISPGDDAVVGVAAPVIVRFGSAPTDKAQIEKHVTITTTPKVEGAWAWITHDGDTWPSLDWRPKDYWPAGTTVHVESDLYGLDLGGGTFGGDKVTSDFTIGRNQVVKADANAHTMVVQQDGVTVATYDASYGSGDVIGDPNRVTRSGIHIVMDKKETTTMSNPAYGYTDVTEHWAVRISDNGEFIHQNQDTVGAQGVDNVSHGCVNLSAAERPGLLPDRHLRRPRRGHRHQRPTVPGRRRHLRLGHPLVRVDHPGQQLTCAVGWRLFLVVNVAAPATLRSSPMTVSSPASPAKACCRPASQQ